jgi:ribosome biogenesis GTPase A
MLEGAESYHLELHLQDIDSTQLRKYFEDQQIIVDFLETQFKQDRLIEVEKVEDLVEMLAPTTPEVTNQESSQEKLPKKKVTFVIPLGLPGMGKSTFNERILENYFS